MSNPCLVDELKDKAVNPQEYLALYSKYDSYPVDTANMLPV